MGFNLFASCNLINLWKDLQNSIFSCPSEIDREKKKKKYRQHTPYNTTKVVVATYLHFKPCTWSSIMTLDRLSICWGRQATTLSPYCRWIWRFCDLYIYAMRMVGLGMHWLRISLAWIFFLVKLDLLLRCVAFAVWI